MTLLNKLQATPLSTEADIYDHLAERLASAYEANASENHTVASTVVSVKFDVQKTVDIANDNPVAAQVAKGSEGLRIKFTTQAARDAYVAELTKASIDVKASESNADSVTQTHDIIVPHSSMVAFLTQVNPANTNDGENTYIQESLAQFYTGDRKHSFFNKPLSELNEVFEKAEALAEKPVLIAPAAAPEKFTQAMMDALKTAYAKGFHSRSEASKNFVRDLVAAKSSEERRALLHAVLSNTRLIGPRLEKLLTNHGLLNKNDLTPPVAAVANASGSMAPPSSPAANNGSNLVPVPNPAEAQQQQLAQ